MKQKNRTSIIFRVFAAGIVLTLILIGVIVAMQSSEPPPETTGEEPPEQTGHVMDAAAVKRLT